MGKIKVIRKKNHNAIDPLKKQKLLWSAGHGLTVGCGLLFSIMYMLQFLLFFKYRNWKWLFLRENVGYSFIKGQRWYHSIIRQSPLLLYKTSLIGVFISYSITMIQNWKGVDPTWNDLLASQNFQSMLIALLWFLTGGKSIYKLAPFMVLASLHFLNQKNEFNGVDNHDEFTRKYRPYLNIVAYAELFTIARLLIDTLVMRTGTSGFTFVFYLGIYWLKLNYSTYAQATLVQVIKLVDDKIPKQANPVWNAFKKYLSIKISECIERNKQIEKESAIITTQ
ncbi:hypothetical protein RNJ44_02988 [Nakaseomyces bracarensis]|uniref:Uncharacterized protein n=1 Tax=Nakaseomyces bracarensis TaxID=273131 RepID=A0ABR4P0W2_9SACH